MFLSDLLLKVEETVERAKEDGNDPSEMKATIQIDDWNNGWIQTDEYEVLYDNYGNVSDCVLHDVVEEDTIFLNEKGFPGVKAILEERKRQINLGWTKEHDIKEHKNFQLLRFAKSYLGIAHFHKSKEKQINDLKKAGALIAAEIDRLKKG